jgi:SAM-dependent methyltransferase
MFDKSTDLYDAIYLAWKDYGREAGKLAGWLRTRRPGATSVLDVACGTGEHARHLHAHGFQVEGVDLSPEFVRVARAKNPGSSFHHMDMLEMELGKRYDAVLCLFSSIGYVKTEANLRRAVERLAAHAAADGGLVVIEPWFEPGAMTDGKVSVSVAEGSGGAKICRMVHTKLRDGLSVLDFQYLIGTEQGIERRSEVHELGLFHADTMRSAMVAAGLHVEYDAEGLMGRGVYIGTRQEGLSGQRSR